jgi:hypothetical protein
MLGLLGMSFDDAKQELHILGTKLRMDQHMGLLPPERRVELLKEGIQEMLRKQGIPVNIQLQDRRFANASCKVYVGFILLVRSLIHILNH